MLDAVESVFRQSESPNELFVVNDYSQDEETNKVCRFLEEKKQVRIIWCERNGGLSAARNTGFESMSGDIAVPLDADDILPVNAISDIRKGFTEQHSIDFLFGDYTLHDVKSKAERTVGCAYLAGDDGKLNPERLIRHWRLLGTSPCSKRLWRKVGGYSLDYTNDLQDKDFWIRAIKAGGQGGYAGKVIYVWRRSAGGMNDSVPQEIQDKLVHDHLDFYVQHLASDQVINLLARLKLFAQLQQYAASCLKRGKVSLRIVFIAAMPPALLRYYYRSGHFSRLASVFHARGKG